MKTVEANNQMKHAYNAAIARIEHSMMPGAVALGESRRPEDKRWREHEREHFGVRLIWREMRATNDFFGASMPSVQLVGADGVSPEVLAVVAKFAETDTAELVRECEARAAAFIAEQEGLVAAYDKVAVAKGGE